MFFLRTSPLGNAMSQSCVVAKSRNIGEAVSVLVLRGLSHPPFFCIKRVSTEATNAAVEGRTSDLYE